MVADVYVAGVDDDFLADVATTLTPGKVAVVADISEGWVTPVDRRMEALGGVVFRTARQDFEAEQRAKEIAALNAEIAELQARPHKRRLSGRPRSRQRSMTSIANRRANSTRQSSDLNNSRTRGTSKSKPYRRNWPDAQQERKTAINNRIAEIRSQYEQTVATLRPAAATQLRKAAAKLKKAS